MVAPDGLHPPPLHLMKDLLKLLSIAIAGLIGAAIPLTSFYG